MADNMEIDSDVVSAGSVINCDYAVQILGALVENDNLRDIKLVAGVDEQQFPVHRLIMMLASKYFQALLGPNFKEGHEEEVTLPNVDGPTLKSIIDFCYSGNIKITDENIMEVISAASAMELVFIEQKCEQFWNNRLAAPNCVETFLQADKYNFLELRKKSLDFICENFVLVGCNKFQELEFSHFSEIMKCDEIQALESSIFLHSLKWVDYDVENRSKYAPELIKLIRLGKIEPEPLLHVVEPFAKKFNCLEVVTNEYRRRLQNDDNTSNPYRHAKVPSESIFVAALTNDTISIEKYNSISNSWKLFATLSIIGIKSRSNCGFVFIENTIIIIGGRKGQTYLRTVNTYNLDQSQQTTEVNIEMARNRFLPILLNDNVYIFGGFNGSLLRSCECLSIATKTTKALQPMHFGRYFYSAAILGGKIYVAGGKNAAYSYLTSVECYDPIEDKWSAIADMNHPRANFGLVEQNGMLYAMGHHESIERYDSLRNVWTVIGSFDENMKKIRRAVNLHGRIYIIMENGEFGFFVDRAYATNYPIVQLCGIYNSNHFSRNLFLSSNF